MSSELQLYPEERNKIISTWAEVQRKFGEKPASRQNLVELADYAEGAFGKVGFKVVVDISNLEVADNGELVHSPVLNIIDRINPEHAHDHEKHSHQVIHGEEDGVVGKISQSGGLLDPKKVL